MSDRLFVTDPATGRNFVIAVEAVRASELDGCREVTGRVVAPRSFRGNLITATVLDGAVHAAMVERTLAAVADEADAAVGVGSAS